MILPGNLPPVARRQTASDGIHLFAPDYLGHFSHSLARPSLSLEYSSLSLEHPFHSLARPSQSVHNKLYPNEIAV